MFIVPVHPIAGPDFHPMEVTMKFRATIAAIGIAAALGITGAIVLPAAASAHAVTHTLTFTSVEQAQAKFSATSMGFEDKAISKADKVIGYDVLNISVDPATGKPFEYKLEGTTAHLQGARLLNQVRYEVTIAK